MHDSENFKERRTKNDSEYLIIQRRKNDRRKFCYTAHAPERRSGMDRREEGANRLKRKVA